MTATAPKPFCKWAGGKTALVPQLLDRIPSTWNPEIDLYIEPFVGSGALFFALRPKNAILNDANRWLMATYRAVRDNVHGLIGRLEILQHLYREQGKAYYYEIRDAVRPASATDVWLETSAEEFIFLNKAGFNGLYRVNAVGKFNVSWGKNSNAAIYDADNLRLCSAALRDVKLCNEDTLGYGDPAMPFGVSTGMLIYCDPPFTPTSKTSNFTAYTPGGFTYADQIRLLARAVEWRRQGAHVILSQAADESLIEQYRRCGFTCDRVQARRAINSKGTGRGPVGEYIIHGGK